MSRSPTKPIQHGAKTNLRPSVGRSLAIEMLDGLRGRAITELTLDAETEQEAEALEAKVRANIRLPVDKANCAIALAYCLAPHFPTVEALATSKALVIIRGRSGDDADAMGDVLATILFNTRQVATTPNYELRSDDQIVVIADASVRHSKMTDRANRPPALQINALAVVVPRLSHSKQVLIQPITSWRSLHLRR